MLIVFPHNLCVSHLDALTFEIHIINEHQVVTGVFGFVHRLPGKAGLGYLVWMNRTVRIGKASLNHTLRGGECHFHGVMPRLGRDFR